MGGERYHHVAGITHQVDRAGRSCRIDQRDAESLTEKAVGLDQHPAAGALGKRGMDERTHCGNPAPVGRLDGLAEELLEQPHLPGLVGNVNGDLVEFVLLARAPVEDPLEVIEEDARPGVAGFRIRGDPDDGGLLGIGVDHCPVA